MHIKYDATTTFLLQNFSPLLIYAVFIRKDFDAERAEEEEELKNSRHFTSSNNNKNNSNAEARLVTKQSYVYW